MLAVQRGIFAALVAVVLISPLPFGSNLTWASSALTVASAVLLVSWALMVGLQPEKPAITMLRIWPAVVLFGLAAVWSVVQMTWGDFSSWHHPLWRDTADLLGVEYAGHITIDPERTSAALTRLLGYGCIFLLSLEYCRNRENARRMFNYIWFGCSLYAGYGLIVYLLGNNAILWFDKEAYPDDLTSTFINRNNYATFAGLGLLCGLGMMFQAIIGRTHRTRGLGRAIVAFVAQAIAESWGKILGVSVLLISIFLSHSRGGLLSFLLGFLALLGALLLSRTHMTSRFKWGATLSVVFLCGGFLVFGGKMDIRLQDLSFERETRYEFAVITLTGIASSPGLGTGYGTFESAFPMYREGSLHRYVAPKVDKAHNTYLETAIELGIPAASALILAVAGVALVCLLGVRRRRRDILFPAIGFAATVLVGVHSVFDFSLQIPAIAVTYAAILGAACAQAWPTARRNKILIEKSF